MEVATGKLFKLKSPPTVVKGRVEYKADSSAMADFMKTNVSVFSLSKYIDVFQNATLLGYKRICFFSSSQFFLTTRLPSASSLASFLAPSPSVESSPPEISKLSHLLF